MSFDAYRDLDFRSDPVGLGPRDPDREGITDDRVSSRDSGRGGPDGRRPGVAEHVREPGAVDGPAVSVEGTSEKVIMALLRENMQLRDEIARLKIGPRRTTIDQYARGR